MNKFQQLVLTKYQHLKENNELETWSDIADRMAAAIRIKDAKLATRLRLLFEDFTLMPQGSILYGLGVPGVHPDWGKGDKMTVSLSNCVVQSIRDDSMEDIMNTGHRAAKCYQYRMGVGTDLSKLRPRGTKVHNAAKTSSGAASFMEYMSTVCGTVGQEGRRGALMLTIDCDHPDVEEFIEKKSQGGAVLNANVSVKILDEFMEAVINEDAWDLQYPTRLECRKDPSLQPKVYKTVSARSLWEKLIECAYNSAEPGTLFWDRVLERPHGDFLDTTPVTTNPCSEIPLPDDDVCLLTSIYLPNFVKDPYTEDAEFDFERFTSVIHDGVDFLDLVKDYDIDLVPFDDIKQKSIDYRRVGLGTHGLGDVFWRLGLDYGSDEAVAITDKIYSTLMVESYQKSIDLAEERGAFPKWEHKDNQWLKDRLPKRLYNRMSKVGRRNIQLNTIAPTGSISVLSNNCSSGIEPAFDFAYDRFCLKSILKAIPHGEFEFFKKVTGEAEPREHMKISSTIAPKERIAVQAKASNYLDHSCSSTVNFLFGTTLKDIEDVFFEAWRSGCEGVTVFVDGSREGIVTIEGAKQQRDMVIDSKSYRFGKGHQRNYITVGLNARGEPMEVLVSNQDMQWNLGLDYSIPNLFKVARDHKLQEHFWDVDDRLPLDQKLAIYTTILLRRRINISKILACFSDCQFGTLPKQIQTAIRLSLPENMVDVTCVKGACE